MNMFMKIYYMSALERQDIFFKAKICVLDILKKAPLELLLYIFFVDGKNQTVLLSMHLNTTIFYLIFSSIFEIKT